MGEIEEKYLTIVKEEETAKEQFVNGNLSSATVLDDYISTDANEGNMKPPESYEKTDKTALTNGKNVKKDKIYFEPEFGLLTGFAGFAWLLQSAGTSLFDDSAVTSIADMDSGDKLYISLNDKRNKSFSVYSSTIYNDSIVYALGAQINELSLALEDGEVAVETNCYASRMVTDKNNLERGLSEYLGDAIRYGFLKDISIATFTELDGTLTVPSIESLWKTVGCDIQQGNLNINFDLQEETGFGFCNDGWSDGFENGAVEVTADVEVTQDSVVWMELTNGGTSEISDLAKKSVKYHLKDSEYTLDIILPKAVLSLDDGAALLIDNPNEKIKFDNETAKVNYNGEIFPSCEGLIVLTKL